MHSRKTKAAFCHGLIILLTAGLYGQFTPNYDESKVPEYVLPELLPDSAGKHVKTTSYWENVRRKEILLLFEDHEYGKIPRELPETTYTLLRQKDNALKGKAFMKQIRVTFFRNGNNLDMDILIFLPGDVERPVPVFLGLNFNGNHTISEDPDILITKNWVPNRSEWGISDNLADESTRGKSASRWPVETIIERGYGLATIYCGDPDPDFDDGFRNGIHALFPMSGEGEDSLSSWGSLGAWAWGLSRALDYFETDADIDHKKVIVLGHSRLGKAALWAGARDERFAMVISNESGCGGAALSMRRFGETVARINTQFPHWFCKNFRRYNDREENLPVDQHMLMALIAPRPVYVASAEEDLWADPRGEYLSLYHAGEVYRLYGLNALPERDMPVTNRPVTGLTTGYHIRSGKHDITLNDWLWTLDFTDYHLSKWKQKAP